MMQIGTDLIKVKKSKNYPRVYHLDEDLLSFSWKSRSKRVAKARSEFCGDNDIMGIRVGVFGTCGGSMLYYVVHTGGVTMDVFGILLGN